MRVLLAILCVTCSIAFCGSAGQSSRR